MGVEKAPRWHRLGAIGLLLGGVSEREMSGTRAMLQGACAMSNARVTKFVNRSPCFSRSAFVSLKR